MSAESQPADPQTPAPTQTNPTPDSVYYFTIVVFRVGNTLFRVPKHGFNVPGTPFEAMFALPQGPVVKTEDTGATRCEGLSDDSPIVLHQVEEEDFRGFLRVLYPFLSSSDISYDDWIGALRLAVMWEFKEVRAKAIKALDQHVTTQNAVQTVLLAKKFNVVRWLRDGYTRLLNETPLPLSNLSLLDWETKCRIYYAKCGGYESYIQSNYGSYYICISGYQHSSGQRCTHGGQIQTASIDKVFGDELKAMEGSDVTNVA